MIQFLARVRVTIGICIRNSRTCLGDFCHESRLVEGELCGLGENRRKSIRSFAKVLTEMNAA